MPTPRPLTTRLSRKSSNCEGVWPLSSSNRLSNSEASGSVKRQHHRLNICRYCGSVDKYSSCQFNQYIYKYWDDDAKYRWSWLVVIVLCRQICLWVCVGTFEASRRLVNPLSRPLMPPSTTLGVRRSDISRAYLPPAPPPPLPCHRVFGQIASPPSCPVLQHYPKQDQHHPLPRFPCPTFSPGSKSSSNSRYQHLCLQTNCSSTPSNPSAHVTFWPESKSPLPS